MRSVHTRILFGGCLAAALLFAGAAQAQTTLRYKFRQGDKSAYDMNQKMTMKISVNGMDVNVTMNMKMLMEQAVTSVTADGKGQLTQKIRHIKADMNGPGANVAYDSDKNKNPGDPAGQLMASMFNALVGADFKLTMAPDGKIVDMDVPDAVTKAMQKAAAGPGGAGMGDMFSKDGLKKLFAQNILLPPEAVAKGKSWKQDMEMKMPFGKMQVTSTYTYDGSVKQGGKDLEKINVSVMQTLTPDPNSPLVLTIKAQSAKGAILFDNQTGRLAESNVNQDVQMEVMAGGQTFNQSIQQNVTLKLLDKGS